MKEKINEHIWSGMVEWAASRARCEVCVKSDEHVCGIKICDVHIAGHIHWECSIEGKGEQKKKKKKGTDGDSSSRKRAHSSDSESHSDSDEEPIKRTGVGKRFRISEEKKKDDTDDDDDDDDEKEEKKKDKKSLKAAKKMDKAKKAKQQKRVNKAYLDMKRKDPKAGAALRRREAAEKKKATEDLSNRTFADRLRASTLKTREDSFEEAKVQIEADLLQASEKGEFTTNVKVPAGEWCKNEGHQCDDGCISHVNRLEAWMKTGLGLASIEEVDDDDDNDGEGDEDEDDDDTDGGQMYKVTWKEDDGDDED